MPLEASLRGCGDLVDQLVLSKLDIRPIKTTAQKKYADLLILS